MGTDTRCDQLFSIHRGQLSAYGLAMSEVILIFDYNQCFLGSVFSVIFQIMCLDIFGFISIKLCINLKDSDCGIHYVTLVCY